MLVIWFSASTCSMFINTTKNFKRLKKVGENQSKIVFFASQPCYLAFYYCLYLVHKHQQRHLLRVFMAKCLPFQQWSLPSHWHPCEPFFHVASTIIYGSNFTCDVGKNSFSKPSTCRIVGKMQARVDQNHQSEPSVTIQSYTRKKGEGNFVKGHNHRWIERLYEAAHLAKDLVIWADQRECEGSSEQLRCLSIEFIHSNQCTWESVTRHTQLVRSTKLMGVMGHIRGGVMISSCEYRPWMCNNVVREEVQECHQTAENVIYLGSSCPMACYHIIKTLPTISYDTQSSCDFTRLARSPPNNLPQR
jgi:hypothetical protein